MQLLITAMSLPVQCLGIYNQLPVGLWISGFSMIIYVCLMEGRTVESPTIKFMIGG